MKKAGEPKRLDRKDKNFAVLATCKNVTIKLLPKPFLEGISSAFSVRWLVKETTPGSSLPPGANPAGNMPTAMDVRSVTIYQDHLHHPGPLRLKRA